jgi:LmbE family N-acetylglucosaminyl deacetylase
VVSANEPGQPPAGRAPTRDVSTWTRDLATPVIALAIGAHPDDVEFGCGATLAKWAAAGCTIHHLVCTDGSKGSWDPHADVAELVRRRRDEQREAAHRLAGPCAGEVRFLGAVDGELSSDLAMRERVARVIRELRPDVVVGHDPWKRYRLHPDHRHAGLLACDGVVAARDPHFFPHQGLAPHRPGALLLFEADEPGHVEDVSEFVEVKLDALLAHASQFESTMKAADESGLDDFRNRVRQRLADLGTPHGLEAAEVFALISDL